MPGQRLEPEDFEMAGSQGYSVTTRNYQRLLIPCPSTEEFTETRAEFSCFVTDVIISAKPSPPMADILSDCPNGGYYYYWMA